MATHGFKKIFYNFIDILPSSRVIARHGRLIATGALITGGLATGYFGYQWYTHVRERNAQMTFGLYEQDYALAAAAGNDQEWARVASLFGSGYEKHTSSNMAPYFLLMQADAQRKQGDVPACLATLDNAIQKAGSSPFVPLMKMRRAFIMLDNADEKMRQEGLDLLIALARDTSNMFNDAALFYLGRYYWEINKSDEAQKVWQELVDSQVVEKGSPSPWVYEAKARLKQLVN